MRLSILLFMYNIILKIASIMHKKFKTHIRSKRVKVLIKTQDNKYSRMFVFDKGTVTSVKGDQNKFDVALIWQDAATGFSVMTQRAQGAIATAVREGKLKIVGKSGRALWFERGLRLIF